MAFHARALKLQQCTGRCAQADAPVTPAARSAQLFDVACSRRPSPRSTPFAPATRTGEHPSACPRALLSLASKRAPRCSDTCVLRWDDQRERPSEAASTFFAWLTQCDHSAGVSRDRRLCFARVCRASPAATSRFLRPGSPPRCDASQMFLSSVGNTSVRLLLCGREESPRLSRLAGMSLGGQSGPLTPLRTGPFWRICGATQALSSLWLHRREVCLHLCGSEWTRQQQQRSPSRAGEQGWQLRACRADRTSSAQRAPDTTLMKDAAHEETRKRAERGRQARRHLLSRGPTTKDRIEREEGMHCEATDSYHGHERRESAAATGEEVSGECARRRRLWSTTTRGRADTHTRRHTHAQGASKRGQTSSWPTYGRRCAPPRPERAGRRPRPPHPGSSRDPPVPDPPPVQRPAASHPTPAPSVSPEG